MLELTLALERNAHSLCLASNKCHSESTKAKFSKIVVDLGQIGCIWKPSERVFGCFKIALENGKRSISRTNMNNISVHIVVPPGSCR